MLALALGACGDAGPGEAGTTTAGGSPEATGNTLPTAQPTDSPQEDDMSDHPRAVAQAIADLARDAGVDPSAIALVSYEQVTWRDGSLGCPQPGMLYSQALVEGFRVTLRVDGRLVHYHGVSGQEPFRCADPAPDGANSAGPGS
jgi:hypothetical protein